MPRCWTVLWMHRTFITQWLNKFVCERAGRKQKEPPFRREPADRRTADERDRSLRKLCVERKIVQ